MPAVRTQPSGPKPLVETKTCAPKTWPCPVCGRPGRRERTLTRWARHLAHGRQAWWKLTFGVYRAKCACCRELMRQVNGRLIPVRKRLKYFNSTIEGVQGHYTDAVRQKVVDLVVRDRLTNDQVIEHLGEDFHLFISVGFIYLCLDWEKKRAA